MPSLWLRSDEHRHVSVVGYARVSTPEQSLEAQRDELERVGAVRVFEDKSSGAKASRPGLDAALDYVREGDVLAVVRLDRLGRRLADLIALTDGLQARGVGFRSLAEGIDTSTTSGRLMLHVVGAVAEMERELTRERTAATLAANRRRGIVGGRRPALTPDAVVAARAAVEAGVTVAEVAKMHGVGVSTLHRYLAAARAADSQGGN